MKRLLIGISLCLPVSLWAQGPRITFRMEKAAGQTVRVIAALDGQFFWGTIRTEMLDSSGTLVLENRETVPGVFSFYCGNGSYSLYVRPGQNYLLQANGEDKENPLSIEAADAEGQLQLNALSREFYQTVGLAYYKSDTSFINNKARVQAALDSSLRLFRVLKERKQIDKGFLTFAIKKCKAYYASVLGATLILPTQQLVFNKDSSAYREAPIRSLQQRWQQLKEICDLADTANTGSGEYLDYSNLYNIWYLGYIRGNLNGTFMKFTSESDYEQFQYNNIRQYYSGPLEEYLWASHLAYLLLEEKFQPVIPKEYEAFTAQYPNSRYTTSMRPGVERLLAYQQKAAEDFTARQQFVTGYDSLRTFDTLAEKFRGKTVFLDLWATWCSPCKDEFAYNKDLRTFLDTKGIIPMYISIDRDQDDQRWKDMIKYYDLQGYHVRANPELMKDIRRLFGSNETLTIPRYVLIKDGKIVGLHMKAPSEKGLLYQQINGYL